ncbi:uncharacterized protein CANTADRAFT_49451 [Suhomyces tanzawaensis NRRL Y-17324]|uniref:Uncharacterized protein n=1 Tax=Suhomyces tanzawaensis NRRL Y-17324 TaxID=984487 RepID=A0A1E4SJG4_9ASCO|nr:uncharacterized protein CANTADRAFT_49451 [Suhomyces tanzawaensis NRRL Y-17324]ODV79630.1 hypothetical protein CANTADRAFT_49451 [Suhomyces tanzawaensis NRRL Y-17324]
MERSFDELQAISTLVQSLTVQLNESGDHIAKLQNIARSLAPKNQFNELCKEVDNDGSSTAEIDREERIIQELERQRLDIVMDLQKQDYMTEKLQSLIDQNEDIVATVKEYLENKDSIRWEEQKHVEQNFDNYVKRVLEPTELKLSGCLQELQNNVSKVANIIKIYSEKSTQEFDLLESQEYRNEVNALIKVLNNVLSEEWKFSN